MVTIDQIKDLRAKTGISMTACKKALEEANGDMQMAIDLLRKKGEAKAVEMSGRTAGEGTVMVAGDSKKKSMILLACETDFVARSDEYQAAAKKLAERVLAEGLDADLTSDVSDLGIQLGEKIELRERALVEGNVVGSYIHSNGKIGVLVALGGGTEDQARDVAIHAAANSPKCVSPEEIDSSLVDKEREIWADQLAQEGKPAEMVEKIMMGKEKKFREEHALLTQPFVKNPEMTVGEYLAGVELVSFVLFKV